MLTLLNLRGVKESVLFLTPIFLIFIITHVLLIGYGLFSHVDKLGPTVEGIRTGFNNGLGTLGMAGMLMLFLHAFSMGGGTYTGIEAVSNGLQILREPKVQTAKKTMVYMATSLAITAGGLMICYLLWGVTVVEGKTMNAALLDKVTAAFSFGGVFSIVTLLTEGALLIVGAQAGFIDGPRVLSNMAADSWLPRRFTSLSDRLTMANGIMLLSIAAIAALIYAHGDVRSLVVMYSINVFLTFSLSMLGMAKHYWTHRLWKLKWRSKLTLFIVGFVFCTLILAVTVFEKFTEGGWVTLVVTGTLIVFCFLIRHHYRSVNKQVDAFSEDLETMPRQTDVEVMEPDPSQPVAGLLVSNYGGIGLHSILTIRTQFPTQFGGFIFISAGQVDSGRFKGAGAIADLQFEVDFACRKYVEFARSLGIPAVQKTASGIDAIETLEQLCGEVSKDYPNVIFFASQIIIEHERWFHSILHNQTAFVLQRKLLHAGHKLIIWPMRIG